MESVFIWREFVLSAHRTMTTQYTQLNSILHEHGANRSDENIPIYIQTLEVVWLPFPPPGSSVTILFNVRW